MSDHRSIAELLARLRPRLARADVSPAMPADLLEEMVEELQVALEQLRVAEEEMASSGERAHARRMEAERPVRQLAELFDTAPVALLLTDAAGCIQRANRFAAELLGVRAPDLAGKPMAVFVAEEDRRAYRRLLQQVVHAGDACAAAFTLRRRHLPAAAVEGMVWPLAVDGVELLGWRLADTLAERAQGEAQSDELAVLRATLDALPGAVAAMDRDGSVLAWNRAARALLGWSEEEVVGRPNPALPDELIPVLDSVRAAGSDPALTLTVTTLAERKDRPPLRVDVALSALTGPDGVAGGTVAVIRPAVAHAPAVPEVEDSTRPRWPASELRRVLFEGASAGEVPERLRSGIAAALDLGYLRPGDRLPGTREAATISGIDHRVISAAYRRLAGEGLVEVRPRRGPVVAPPPAAETDELGETPEWLAGVLEGAAQLQVRVPALADLVRRWTAQVPVRCLCVDDTEDGRAALTHEMSAQWGMECTALASDERGGLRELASAVRASDLVVTTHRAAGAVRSLARGAGKPVVVAAVRADLAEALEEALRRGPVTAVVADAAFAERLRVAPGGERLRVVLAGDEAAIDALPADQTVLMTLAAQQKVRRPLRLLAAPGHFVAPLDARALARVLIRANLSPARVRSQV